jgi:hypothetical protein
LGSPGTTVAELQFAAVMGAWDILISYVVAVPIEPSSPGAVHDNPTVSFPCACAAAGARASSSPSPRASNAHP